MSNRRLLALCLSFLLVAGGIGLSGCFGKKSGDPAESKDPGRLALSFIGLGAPDGEDDVVVDVTIDHVALLGSGEKWRDLLSAPVDAEVLLEEGFGEPAFLADVPVPPGEYTAIEIIASAAEVTSASGAKTATIDAVACYAAIAIQIAEGGVAELQLLLSGPDALELSGSTWVFRPAVVGSFAPEDASGEAAIDEPDCRPLG